MKRLQLPQFRVRHIIKPPILAALIAVLLLVAATYFAYQQNQARLGAVNPPVTLKWQVSDHDTTGKPLSNDSNDTSQAPAYFDQVTQLNRTDSGDIQNLPRFQGEMRLTSP